VYCGFVEHEKKIKIINPLTNISEYGILIIAEFLLLIKTIALLYKLQSY